MKRYKISTAAIAVAAMLVSASSASANTLYFQMNPNFDTGGVRQLFLFGPAGSTGTVLNGAGFSESFDLGTAGFSVISIPVGNELGNASTENKGFKVESSSAISGYYLSRRSASTDMTYLIDGSRLGTSYFTLGYQNLSADQISVQATVDNTVVTFTPKGAPAFDITLNAGQTYMYTANTNLTGSRVTSNNPIAVFSGNRCTNIPTGVSACDHIVEQMPPTDALSSSYLLAQTPRTGTLGNVFRAVATDDATELRVNGTVVATLNTGEFFEGRVAGGITVDGSKPILVGQYLIGQGQAGSNTDPAMTIVPGADQWLSSYVFAAPSGSANFPTDFVSIIIQTSSLGSLTVDGALAEASLFNPLGSTIYSYGNIDVSGTTGPFSITAATPFQLLLSGFDSFDSYFTFGGAAFSPGASPPPDTPPPPPPPPNTDLFWDGDGIGSANNSSVDGGDGTLTATSLNLTLENGATNNALPGTPATVVFRGTPGTVTVDDVNGPLTFSGLRFLVDGYRIVGDPIALGGATPAIQVGTDDDATALFAATVDAVLTGTAGLRKSGKGTLVLTAANSYDGGTSVNQGVLVGNAGTFGTGAITIAADAQLIFDQQVDGSFGNGINGTGTLIKDGAAKLILTGENSFTGGTFVEAGNLQVDGDLGGSAVTVRNGATLSGNGQVKDTILEAGSRIAPGASIGTLDLVGAFTQSTGSTYAVELNSTGETDLINIAGTATIEGGTTISVTKLDAGRLALGARYTVLSASGGLTGTYTTVTGPAVTVSRFIAVSPSYDANNVYLNVARSRAFAASGSTPNQIAAASGADNAGNGAMYTALAYLQTDAEAQAAFDAISGEVHASARGATLEDTRFVREAMINRTIGNREAGKGLWFHGYGSWGDFNGDGNAADMSRDIAGFFIGGEMVSDSGLVVGAVTGYGEANISVDDRASRADTADAYLGAYVGLDAAGFSIRGGLAYMWRDVKTVRRVAIPGFTDNLTASYNLDTFQMFADAGYGFALGGVELEPFFQLAYVDIGSGSFTERGASAALQGSGGADFWLTQLGTRFQLGLGGGGLALRGSLGWRHVAGGDQNTPVTMNFAAGPAFSIAGAPVAGDAAAMSLSIAGKLSKSIEIDAGYSGVAGDGVNDHGIRAAVTFRF
jgi:outer membrane autotransporter protein